MHLLMKILSDGRLQLLLKVNTFLVCHILLSPVLLQPDTQGESVRGDSH